MVSIVIVREAWRNLKETPWPFFTFLSIVVNAIQGLINRYLLLMVVALLMEKANHAAEDARAAKLQEHIMDQSQERLIQVLMNRQGYDTVRH